MATVLTGFQPRRLPTRIAANVPILTAETRPAAVIRRPAGNGRARPPTI
ncbi:MAG: hypothetical protein WB868_15110 [Xanthobacteraceae bacterium]